MPPRHLHFTGRSWYSASSSGKYGARANWQRGSERSSTSRRTFERRAESNTHRRRRRAGEVRASERAASRRRERPSCFRRSTFNEDGRFGGRRARGKATPKPTALVCRFAQVLAPGDAPVKKGDYLRSGKGSFSVMREGSGVRVERCACYRRRIRSATSGNGSRSRARPGRTTQGGSSSPLRRRRWPKRGSSRNASLCAASARGLRSPGLLFCRSQPAASARRASAFAASPAAFCSLQ